jgi:iron complex outermembrane receptor protein
MLIAVSITAGGSPAAADDAGAGAAAPRTVEDLRDFSIEQLASLPVTSATKSSTPLRDAPASIYVISHDDIVRSGARSLPEALRLAPNLQIAQTSATNYVITARGFSGNNGDQAFSNKLLVLIDGRSVYTPLFSGVYWDTQDVPLDDIDRIEVISGPGSALWGANAVNGVINIITRKAAETQGGLVEAEAGNRNRGVSVRYGGMIGPDLAWRLYVKDERFDDTLTSAGVRTNDGEDKPQGGGRIDWTPTSHDTVTLQGDDYQGVEAQQGAGLLDLDGSDVLARWSHACSSGATFQVQTYWDRTRRFTEGGGGGFSLDTYDIDSQAGFALGAAQQIVVGAGFRQSAYDIVGAPTLLFAPATGNLALADGFVQDSLRVDSRITLIAGVKLENDPYSGFAALPSIRLSFKPDDRVMVWAAASRAIRSPTPFDTDVIEKIGSTVYLVGAPDFRPETLTAYETGARLQPSPRLSVSVSTYYNVYDDLRSVESTPTSFIPLYWGNDLRGHTWGLDAWSDYKVADWWRLKASFSLLREQLGFKSGASGLLGVAQAGDDPRQRASLGSTFDLGPRVSLAADLRYVDALPDPFVPAYVELNSRLAWAVSRRLELSLAGFNLLHAHHQEFPAPRANAVPRSVEAALRYRF